jgi:hypothetical protein
VIKRLEKLLAAKAKAAEAVKAAPPVKAKDKPSLEPGNPGMRSPASVTRDRQYRVVSEAMASTWPQSIKIVVQHLGTERFFTASYVIGNDDSEADLATSWQQVKPKTKNVTEYE